MLEETWWRKPVLHIVHMEYRLHGPESEPDLEEEMEGKIEKDDREDNVLDHTRGG